MQSLLETAKSAIAAIQQGSGPSVLQASQWLFELEQREDAWGVAWELVNGEGPSQEETTYRFFGAKIIYSKIQRDFDQLGSDQVAEFTQKLVSRVIELSQNYGEDVSFVVCRYLCLSIAAIALQVNREGVVNQILMWFNPILQSAPRVMLELLYLLPEECDNYQIDVDRDTRDMFAYQLTESFDDVASFLLSLLESSACTDFTKIKILNCLAAWIENTFVAGSQVAAHPTYATALSSLYSPNTDVSEAAVEVVIATFERFGGSNQDILVKSLPQLVNLAPLWQQASSSPDCEEGDDAYDVCKHIARVVTEVADNCSRFLLLPPTDEAMHSYKQGIFHLVFECCKHPLDDISCIPLSFVDNFTSDLTELYLEFLDESDSQDAHKGSHKARVSPTEAWNYVKEAYFNHLLSFLQTCSMQCARSSTMSLSTAIHAVMEGRAGPNGDAAALAEMAQGTFVMSEEGADQRKKWLSAVANVCSLVDRVLGPDAPLLALAESLRRTVEEARNVAVMSISQVSAAAEMISSIEAHLYLLTAALPYINKSEAQATPWLLENVLLAACPIQISVSGVGKTIPCSVLPQLYISILKCIGAASKWLTNQQLGAQYLPQALSCCSSQLAYVCFQKAAASSLKSLLGQCGHIDGVQDEAMKIYNIILVARRQGLTLSADLDLLEGVCDAMSAFCKKVADQEGENQLQRYILAIVEPMTSEFSRALGLPPPPPHTSPAVSSADLSRDHHRLTSAADSIGSGAGGEGSRDGLIVSLERLCVVLRCLRLKPDLYMSLLRHQVLSLLRSLLENRPYSSQLCEKVCRCYKHAIRNATNAFEPELPGLLHHLSVQFSRQHDAGYVYITAIAVKEYCRGCIYDPSRASGPLLLEAITSITDNFFERFKSPEDFVQCPDVVEEYFCLLQTTLQVAPAIYFSLSCSDRGVASLGSTFRTIVYPACIAAMQTSHRDVHKAAVTFFRTLMTTAEGDRRRKGENSGDESRLRDAALFEIRHGAGSQLVAGTLRFVASQEAKVALGGDTDTLGLILLSMNRVLSRAARESKGEIVNEFEGWLHEAVVGLDVLPASAISDTAAANNNDGGSESRRGPGGGGLKPSLAIKKGKVCELFIRGDEDLALDAFYRFHKNCVGGRD